MESDINKLQKYSEALDEILEKEHDITNIHMYNLSCLQELMNNSNQYAIEKAKGDVFTRVALQAAYLEGAKWADEHPRKHYKR